MLSWWQEPEGGGLDMRAHTHTHTDALLCSGIRPSLDPGFEASREVVSSLCVGSHDPAHSPTQELMEVVHLHLVKEYIVRLSKRRLVLKTAEQQQQLAGHILANAELIQRFCTQNVSPHPPLPAPTPIGCPPAPSSSRARTAPLGLSKPNQVGPEPLWAPGWPPGQGQPPSNQACACRAPRQPGCIVPSPCSQRLFACKTPAPSRSRWPHVPPGTLTSGESRAPEDLGR